MSDNSNIWITCGSIYINSVFLLGFQWLGLIYWFTWSSLIEFWAECFKSFRDFRWCFLSPKRNVFFLLFLTSNEKNIHIHIKHVFSVSLGQGSGMHWQIYINTDPYGLRMKKLVSGMVKPSFPYHSVACRESCCLLQYVAHLQKFLIAIIPVDCPFGHL